MIKFFQNLYEYFFSQWIITIIEEGCETWISRPTWALSTQYDVPYRRAFVKYRYQHKFRNQQKIVKEYIS